MECQLCRLGAEWGNWEPFPPAAPVPEAEASLPRVPLMARWQALRFLLSLAFLIWGSLQSQVGPLPLDFPLLVLPGLGMWQWPLLA